MKVKESMSQTGIVLINVTYWHSPQSVHVTNWHSPEQIVQLCVQIGSHIICTYFFTRCVQSIQEFSDIYSVLYPSLYWTLFLFSRRREHERVFGRVLRISALLREGESGRGDLHPEQPTEHDGLPHLPLLRTDVALPLGLHLRPAC